MATTNAAFYGRTRWATRTTGGDLHAELLEVYWIIDVMPGESTLINHLKESITDAILSDEVVRMERVLDEAQIAIGFELSSAIIG